MSAPTAPMAAQLYADTAPLWQEDAKYDYAGAALCTALTVGVEGAYAVSLDTTLFSDPVNAPDFLIPGMARRAGLRNAYGESIARLRDRLVNPPAFETGSSAAIAESVNGVLTSPGLYTSISVASNYHPISGPLWGHTTVTVDPDDAVGVTLDQIQAAAEQGAPDWVVIHAVIAEGAPIDNLTDNIDDLDAPINEL